MHRRTRGLLSLMMAFVMVAATVSPVLADELPQGQPAADGSVTGTELEETGETGTEMEEMQPDSDVLAVEEHPETSEQLTVTQDAPVPETVQTDLTEQPATETLQVQSTGDPANEDLYPNLTSDQIKFDVYTGTQPIENLLSDSGILSKLHFTQDGVVPDSVNLDSQSAKIISAILEGREGDDRFYVRTDWKLWSVDSSGKPQTPPKTVFALSKLATTQNFIDYAYMENNETGSSPKVICKKPILEPVWSCVDYPIPVYDAQGQDTGLPLTVNAENYQNIAFPSVEADSWKLLYEGSEYQLKSASEIWTNTTNGIGTIGPNFDEKNAKLQAYKSSTADEVKYEISGPQAVTQGWYTGTVTIRAKDGYQIRLSEADAWTDAVVITQSVDVMLYVKKADGTEYPAEALSFLIDGADPVIAGIQNGQTYYGDTPVAVTDAYLMKVTVNDEPQTIVNNQVNVVLKPSEQPYIIKAEDMAGNWIEMFFWVKEEPVTEAPSEEPSTESPSEEPSTEVPSEEPSTESPSEEPSTEPSDKTAPVIRGVSGGGIYYGNQTVTVTDENLQKVTVNGEAVEISDNRAEFTVKPSDDFYQVVIAAQDKAGNRTECAIEVWETWVRDGIMENGKKKLRRERIYKLGKGQWTVNGDSTVYQGGSTFYVKNSATYQFKKK